jgi:hypothetical protein
MFAQNYYAPMTALCQQLFERGEGYFKGCLNFDSVKLKQVAIKIKILSLNLGRNVQRSVDRVVKHRAVKLCAYFTPPGLP